MMKKILVPLVILLLGFFLVSCESSQEQDKENVYQEKVQQEEIPQETINNENGEETSLIFEEVLTEDILDGSELIGETLEENSELTEYEINSLIHMREEEKLARDVYLTLYDIWGQKIFSNIAKSESTHTLAVKALLDTYNIKDPVTDDTVGVFQIPEMQELYDSLVAQGRLSLGDALTVGSTIEDLDIYDIQEFKKQIQNEAILRVYNNLERGSRNHMRAFTKNLDRLGLTYTPSYISEAHYKEIISSEQERGGGQGNGIGGGNRGGKY